MRQRCCFEEGDSKHCRRHFDGSFKTGRSHTSQKVSFSILCLEEGKEQEQLKAEDTIVITQNNYQHKTSLGSE